MVVAPTTWGSKLVCISDLDDRFEVTPLDLARVSTMLITSVTRGAELILLTDMTPSMTNATCYFTSTTTMNITPNTWWTMLILLQHCPPMHTRATRHTAEAVIGGMFATPNSFSAIFVRCSHPEVANIGTARHRAPTRTMFVTTSTRRTKFISFLDKS